MKSRELGFPVIILTSLFMVSIFLMSPVTVAGEGHYRNEQDTDWTLNSSFGTPFWIAFNSRFDDPPTGMRQMFLYLEGPYFTLDNVKAIFTGLAEQYSKPNDMIITAFTDREALRRAISNFKAPVCLFLSKGSPELEQANRKLLELYIPPKTGYFRAHYFRSVEGERMYFSPNAEKEESIVIKLRGGSVPYSGELTSDLVLASQHGDLPRVTSLLMLGANINRLDTHGHSAIGRAALAGYRKVLETLLAAGADANRKDRDGSTALTLATLKGNIEIVAPLLDSGADPQQKEGLLGRTPLMLAVDSPGLVQMLLSKGASVNEKMMRVSLRSCGQ